MHRCHLNQHNQLNQHLLHKHYHFLLHLGAFFKTTRKSTTARISQDAAILIFTIFKKSELIDFSFQFIVNKLIIVRLYKMKNISNHGLRARSITYWTETNWTLIQNSTGGNVKWKQKNNLNGLPYSNMKKNRIICEIQSV